MTSENRPQKEKLLFICTANSERSPTAEAMFQESSRYEASSAGISAMSARVVDQELINRADKIFVMSELEDGHLSFLKSRFDLSGKDVYSLEIPDMFMRGSPALKSMLREKLSSYLEM